MIKTRDIILATLILLAFWVGGWVQVTRYKNTCELVGNNNQKWYECTYKGVNNGRIYRATRYSRIFLADSDSYYNNTNNDWASYTQT